MHSFSLSVWLAMCERLQRGRTSEARMTWRRYVTATVRPRSTASARRPAFGRGTWSLICRLSGTKISKIPLEDPQNIASSFLAAFSSLTTNQCDFSAACMGHCQAVSLASKHKTSPNNRPFPKVPSVLTLHVRLKAFNWSTCWKSYFEKIYMLIGWQSNETLRMCCGANARPVFKWVVLLMF